jgi:hypothetical protein
MLRIIGDVQRDTKPVPDVPAVQSPDRVPGPFAPFSGKRRFNAQSSRSDWKPEAGSKHLLFFLLVFLSGNYLRLDLYRSDTVLGHPQFFGCAF